MGEDTKGKKRRRKKKSKFWYYLYSVVILILTITNITLATLLLTHVQNFQVTGVQNSQQSEIVAWIKKDPLTSNSLYTLWKFKFANIKLPVYLEDVSVSLAAPWKVNVKVKEKQVIACVQANGSYVCFDEEGLVLQKGSQYDAKIPLIEGLDVTNTEKFSYLKTDNEKVFSYIVSIIEELQTHELNPDRIAWEEESMNLYFQDICVKLGKSNFDDKIRELPPLLEKAKGEKGIFHMEHYSSDSIGISFEKSDEESEKNY